MGISKAKVLETLDESARVHDAELAKNIAIATHPAEHGWRRSLLTAAIVVPLIGISATLTDLVRVCVSHSDPEAWDRGELPPATDVSSETNASPSEPATD